MENSVKYFIHTWRAIRLLLEIIKFIGYSILIVLISKYILVRTLRKLAENLKLKAKSIGDIAGAATSMPELLTIITSNVRGLARCKYIQHFKFKCYKFNTIFSINCF